MPAMSSCQVSSRLGHAVPGRCSSQVEGPAAAAALTTSRMSSNALDRKTLDSSRPVTRSCSSAELGEDLRVKLEVQAFPLT
eukprot:7829497-Lingulodinium_polyedra.AAC.1